VNEKKKNEAWSKINNVMSDQTEMKEGVAVERRGRVIQVVQEEFSRELLEHLLSVSVLL
jgi:hypothetical protein